jgi:hypothetical protein
MRDKTVEERQACVAVDENFSMQNSFFRGGAKQCVIIMFGIHTSMFNMGIMSVITILTI